MTVGAITVTAQATSSGDDTTSKGMGTSTWPPAETYSWPLARQIVFTLSTDLTDFFAG
jgi:hypothetical protein